MHRRLLVPLALLLGASAFVSLPRLRSDVQGQARLTTRTIFVTLKCETQSGWVSDSSLRAVRGDTINFELTQESDVTDFKVKRKTPIFGRWLFRRSELVGGPGNPARGNDMKPKAEGRYRYKVEGTCRGGPKAIIDPDIIIELDD